MKTILCFGDSNTWGYDPGTRDRFPRDVRWPGVMRKALGDGFLVVEEGLNGRTTVWDDPIEGYKNGHDYLIPCLETHRPLDLAILMLGSNDLKVRFSVSAFDVAESAGVLVDAIQNSGTGPNGTAPAILLVAPPKVGKLTEFAQMFEGAQSKSLRFPEEYQRVAGERGCAFFDAASVARPSDKDGIHLEADQHKNLGEALAEEAISLLG